MQVPRCVSVGVTPGTAAPHAGAGPGVAPGGSTSSAFGANAAWYRLSFLALNLYQALATLALPRAWRRERLATARFRWLNRAGRVVSHARRHIVALPHLVAGLPTICLEARAARPLVCTPKSSLL